MPPQRDGVPLPPRSGTGEQPQPAFGPEPPRAHQAGPAFPDADTPTGATPSADPDGWPSPDDYYWYSQTPNGAYTTEAPGTRDHRRAGRTDPFADTSGTEHIWDHPSANPPWAEPSTPPPGPAYEPADEGRSAPDPANGTATDAGSPADDTEPGDSETSAAEDELLPPADGVGKDTEQEHPTLTVRALQPATVYRQAITAAPEAAAGDPPSTVTAAAALCGLLAVPMLATAGALFGGVSGGLFQLLLPVLTLLLAAGCVVGGMRLVSRGSPLLSLFIALVAVVAAVSTLVRLGSSLTDLLLAALWTVFTPIALIMVALLRGRRVRRWLIARSQEWQASRPPSRRRFRLPAVHISLPKPARRDPKRSPARKPTRVKQVGRHAPQRRSWIPWRRGPVSYVGRDSPRTDRDG